MSEFKKGEIKANQDYLKSWDEYEAEEIQKPRHRKHPLLMPIRVDLDGGIIKRERIKSYEIERIWANHHQDIPAEYFKEENRWALPDPEKIFQDYVDAFPNDKAQSGLPPNPLDIVCHHPTWLLFEFRRENWKFSEKIQYSVENDPDDTSRNFEKVCTMDDRKYLILSNRHRSEVDDLKYNLHANIYQKQGGIDMWTDIIIDPGGDNRGGRNP